MMENKRNWSLENWLESWVHDEWDAERRASEQRALGHNIIYEFFQEFPELDPVVDIIFEEGNVTCNFFGKDIIMLLHILSQISKSKKRKLADNATRLINRIIQFVLDSEEKSVNLPDKYSDCALTAFSEAFSGLGEERDNIYKRLPQLMKGSVDPYLGKETQAGVTYGKSKRDKRVYSRFIDIINGVVKSDLEQ